MKLKSDWLETLSTAARLAPVEMPDPLPRTAARVLANCRDDRVPSWNRLVSQAAIVSLSVAMLLTPATVWWAAARYSVPEDGPLFAQLDLIFSTR